MSPRPSAALTAWTELNDRQQGTLAAIYKIDQAIEERRRRGAARGDFDKTPAAQWRRIDFTHEPQNRKLLGTTELQDQLATRGWDNQGNGSTMAALGDRRLITRDIRVTTFGVMHTVALTRQGRAAARAGTSLNTGKVAKAGLGRRSWEVLALLWAADLAGKHLDWVYSKTIEFALIEKHLPPLAESAPGGGYRITDRGRDFYREQYPVHTAAHPDVHALHPDGVDAEPWPPRADEILGLHRRHYRALVASWRTAHDLEQAAQTEADKAAPEPVAILPAVVAQQIAARHQLWQDTARQRAQLAGEHAADLHQRAIGAARMYATAALTVFQAAVTRADPLAALHGPSDYDSWDEPPLALPAETGIHAIDTEVKKLHATAVGTPPRRRGPAPKHRPRRFTQEPDCTPQPGADLATLADHLGSHTQGGALLRRLHQ